jgi:hypothetical protein
MGRLGFSPTTRYRYAINRGLIHWESQSSTGCGPVGDIATTPPWAGSFCCSRVTRADDRAFWFLGPASYVQHEGERAMAVTWKLGSPLSGDLFAAFVAAVA